MSLQRGVTVTFFPPYCPPCVSFCQQRILFPFYPEYPELFLSTAPPPPPLSLPLKFPPFNYIGPTTTTSLAQVSKALGPLTFRVWTCLCCVSIVRSKIVYAVCRLTRLCNLCNFLRIQSFTSVQSLPSFGVFVFFLTFPLGSGVSLELTKSLFRIHCLHSSLSILDLTSREGWKMSQIIREWVA